VISVAVFRSRSVETGCGLTHRLSWQGQSQRHSSVPQGLSGTMALDLWIIQMGKYTLLKQERSLSRVSLKSVAACRLRRVFSLLHNLVAVLVDVPLIKQLKAGD